MNILIYGYGLKGGGFYNAMYFLKKGHKVRLTDIRDEASLGESATYLKTMGVEIIAGSHRIEDFKWADVVIKTPAVTPDSPFLEYSKKTMNDFSFLFSSKHTAKVKLICITGTVGKTITSAAVCHALNKLGKKTRMCGNMGISPFSELEKWERRNIPEFLVCELSSLQVRDTSVYMQDKIPAIELAVLTNSLEYENDSTSDIQSFYNNKMSMFKTNVRNFLCHETDREKVSKAVNRSTRKISSIESMCSGMKRGIPENLKTSFAVLKKLGFSSDEINEALKSFKGVPHRNEMVKCTKNIFVINDSASVIPQAVSFTVNNLKGLQINLICGGTGKNLNASEMVEAIKNVSSVTLLDGSFTREILIPELDKKGIKYSGPYTDMEEAVKTVLDSIKKESTGTQAILLSPGASAFELFANEYERGDRFKACFAGSSKKQSTYRSVKILL